MFKSFILTAYRQMMRNKLFSLLNLLGLSIAIGCSIIVFLFIHAEFTFDSFHKNAQQIFLVESNIERNGATNLYGLTPIPLGPLLESDFPQVEKSVRILQRDVKLETDEARYDEEVYFVDDGFFDIFTFPILEGDKNSLAEASSAIITEKYAKKYYKNENPIGKELVITLHDTIKTSFIVSAIAEDIPYNAGFYSQIYLPFKKIEQLGVKKPDNWAAFVSATFIYVNKPEDIENIRNATEKYISAQNSVEDKWVIRDFVFDPLLNIKYSEQHLQYNINDGFEPVATFTILSLGLVLLAVACINYANNSVVSMSKRFREIGVRKVIGGSRKLIIWQFLGENLLLCFFSLVLGILIAKYIFLPAWINIIEMPLEINLVKNFDLFLYLTILLLATGFATGSYPAFFVSKFKPVDIFKNRVHAGGQSLFIRILMTTQFIVTFMAIVFSVALYQNQAYLKKCDWGYNYEGTIVIPLTKFQDYDVFKNEISTMPQIKSIAGTFNHLKTATYNELVKVDGKDFKSSGMMVGAGYIETVGLRLLQGRSFSKDNYSDWEHSVIINEKFMQNAGITDPLNAEIIAQGKTYSVVGVVEDFREWGFDNDIFPNILHLDKRTSGFSTMVIRVEEGSMNTASEKIKSAWEKLYPDTVYPGYFQNKEVKDFFDEYKTVAAFLSFPILMTILLTAMGIFGLVSANISNRRKEISIRKVLGASLGNIINIVSRQLLWVIAIASVIAALPAYYLATQFIDNLFSVYVEPNFITMVISFAVILMAAVLPLAPQILRAANTNPTDALRSE